MTSLFRNTGKPLRVAVYHRTGKPSALAVCSNELLKNQLSREIIQNDNMIIADYYFDDSPVGADISRERERLLTDCRAGKIDAVMTRSIRRFCPDYKILLEVVRELSTLTPPVDVYFMLEQVHSTGSEGEILQFLLKEGASA